MMKKRTRHAGEVDALHPLPWHELARASTTVLRMTLLLGPPGSGKSAFVQRTAIDATGAPPEEHCGSARTEEDDLWGRIGLETRAGASATVFQEGPLARALRQGRWMLIEEIGLIPPQVRGTLLSLRDNEVVHNPRNNGEAIRVHPAFRLVATSNKEQLRCSQHTAATQAFYDRVGLVEVPPMDEASARRVLAGRAHDIPAKQQEAAIGHWLRMRRIRTETKSDTPYEPSVRAAEDVARLMNAGVPRRQALAIGLAGKYAFDAELYEAAQLRIQMDDLREDD
jgi:nitric oxide reductase NorQ protein